jgi:hypothetical protein
MPSILTPQRTACEATQTAKAVPGKCRNVERLCRYSRKKRRGAAVVEMAIVTPLFLFLVFGMIEFGRMVMVQQVLVNATREGARHAVLDGSSRTEVNQVVNQYLTASAINNARVDVFPADPAQAAAGEPVRVTISVRFSEVSWLPVPMFLGERDLVATSVMRRESTQGAT